MKNKIRLYVNGIELSSKNYKIKNKKIILNRSLNGGNIISIIPQSNMGIELMLGKKTKIINME